MRALIILFFYFSVLYLPSYADANRLSGGGGGMQLGIAGIPMNSLNKYLADNGISQLSPGMLTFGGNGQGVIKNFIIGGGMYRYNNIDKSQININTISTSLQYGVLNIGYILYNSSTIIAYPVLGTGYCTFTLNSSQKGDLNFIQAIQNPDKEINLKNGSMIIDLGCIFEYFPLSKNKTIIGGPCIGIKLGAFVSPGIGKWKYPGGGVFAAPEMRVSGFYIRTLYKGYVFH